MSHKSMIAAFTAVIMLVACTTVLAATNSLGIAEKQMITFDAPTVIGGTVLPAGEYKVTHEMQGKTHVMIFSGKKGEAKTNCNLVPLQQKAEQTQQRYTVNANDQHVLQEITFQGDKATHVLAQ